MRTMVLMAALAMAACRADPGDGQANEVVSNASRPVPDQLPGPLPHGELVKLAERIGADAPVNRKVVELIRKAEGGAPPWPPAALRREVLGG